MFKPKEKKSFVAINIGNKYIKALVKKNSRLTNYYIEPRLDKILDNISETNKSPVHLRISLKSSSSVVRYFTFPKMKKDKLKESLVYELHRQIPFPPEEVYFDFHVFKEVNDTDNLIVLAAAKKDVVDSVLEMFPSPKFLVDEINLDSVCLLNLLLDDAGDDLNKNLCLLDIGYSFSTIIIVSREEPFLTRDLRVGARDMLKVAAAVKGVDLDSEESERELVESCDFLELANDSLSGLFKEMKESFDYFELNTSQTIEKVYLSGGISSLDGMTRIFQDKFGVETVNFVPRELNVFMSDTEKENKFLFNSLAVCSGLAIT